MKILLKLTYFLFVLFCSKLYSCDLTLRFDGNEENPCILILNGKGIRLTQIPFVSHPLADHRLSPVPFQDNPQLYKVTCVSPNSREFYVWLTRHDFPIEATIPPHRINEILKECSFFLQELVPNGRNEESISPHVLKQYGLLFTSEAEVERLTKTFREERERIYYNGLTPQGKARRVYRKLPFDTAAYEAKWVVKAKIKIEKETQEYSDKLREKTSRWFDNLPKEAQEFIKDSFRSRKFDFNTIHPTVLYEVVCAKVSSYHHEHHGLDRALQRRFLGFGRSFDAIHGLEEVCDRYTPAKMEQLSAAVRSDNSFFHGYRLDYLRNVIEHVTEAKKGYFKWCPVSIAYHGGRPTVGTDPTVKARDVMWVPRYLQFIRDFINSNFHADRFFMCVGAAHGEHLFATLKQHPDLINRISRYNAEKGWVSCEDQM